jgi:hypothetical protein
MLQVFLMQRDNEQRAADRHQADMMMIMAMMR